MIISVIIITYNHEHFISEAINGVLMQEVKFPIELIIADDCSPDKTKFVVESFKTHKNYNWIKYTRHQTNKGMMANFMWALQQSKGKYIALCEGDDYWTDPYKLQKQVDFLEANPLFSVVGHRTQIFNQYEGVFSGNYELKPNVNKTLNLSDAILGPPMHTSSLLFRNSSSGNIKFPKLPSGDEALSLHLLSKGKGYYFSDTMSVYRISEVGNWSTRSVLDKNTITLQLQLWILSNYPFYIFKQLKKISNYGKDNTYWINIPLLYKCIVVFSQLIFTYSKLHFIKKFLNKLKKYIIRKLASQNSIYF
jgi:glycosyltransferase involved in cell wall biosynthesis